MGVYGENPHSHYVAEIPLSLRYDILRSKGVFYYFISVRIFSINTHRVLDWYRLINLIRYPKDWRTWRNQPNAYNNRRRDDRPVLKGEIMEGAMRCYSCSTNELRDKLRYLNPCWNLRIIGWLVRAKNPGPTLGDLRLPFEETQWFRKRMRCLNPFDKGSASLYIVIPEILNP